MKALLVGSGPLNGRVEAFLSQHRVACETVAADALRRLDGEVGVFTAVTAGGVTAVSFAVLTEQPNEPPPAIDGGTCFDLYEEETSALPGYEKGPVLFLLDYFCESPLAATQRALSEARGLALRKRQAYVLSRFVRTAAYGGEALYRSARQAGVTFIKYEQLDIVFQEGEGFAVTVFDGDLSHAFTAVSVFADGPAGPIPAYAHALQALRIQADAQGFAAAPFFLAPALTSRRGVYRVGRDAAERLEESLCAILADACAPHPSRHVAEVDGAKCVLCWSCYRACPHAALAPDTAARRMNVLPSACQGCGVCASVCPGGAISLSQDSARKAMGKTLVLCCKNSAEAAARELPPGVGIDIVPLPCGGSADAGMLASALGRYEKVFLAVCRDDACRHFTGNRRACAQAERLVQELVQAGLPVERLGFAKVSHALPGEFRAQLAVFLGGAL